jgi:hypothetical protein
MTKEEQQSTQKVNQQMHNAASSKEEQLSATEPNIETKNLYIILRSSFFGFFFSPMSEITD